MSSTTDRFRRKASVALAALLAASLARADDRAMGPPAPPRPPVVRPAPLPSGELAPGSRWSLLAGQSSVFDTNIDHVTPARADYGVVFMGGAGWQNRASRPSLTFRYEAALHRYLDSPQWDRVSQRAEAAFEKRLSKRWTTETRGEVSLKGSSEDRELANQYTILQQMDLRLVRGLDLRLYGLARLKRYPEPDRDRDATNTYAGTALRLRLGAARFEIGSRYEDNAAREERRDYERWVHRTGLATTLGRRDEIDLDVKLYDQQYPFRTVEEGPAEGRVRQDKRLVSAVSWIHRFRSGLGVELAYKHERRTSNDPDKGFDAHQLAVAFQYRFERPRSRAPESSESKPKPRGQERAIS